MYIKCSILNATFKELKNQGYKIEIIDYPDKSDLDVEDDNMTILDFADKHNLIVLYKTFFSSDYLSEYDGCLLIY